MQKIVAELADKQNIVGTTGLATRNHVRHLADKVANVADKQETKSSWRTWHHGNGVRCSVHRSIGTLEASEREESEQKLAKAAKKGATSLVKNTWHTWHSRFGVE